MDVTVAELAIESFYPADEATAAVLSEAAAAWRPGGEEPGHARQEA
jgi:hypothetical protein